MSKAWPIRLQAKLFLDKSGFQSHAWAKITQHVVVTCISSIPSRRHCWPTEYLYDLANSDTHWEGI